MSKNPSRRLQVKMLLENGWIEENDVFIDRPNAVDTFLEAIDRIGIEEVRELGIEVEDIYVEQVLPLIVTQTELNSIEGKYQDYYRRHASLKYWIHINTNTNKKRELLEEIAMRGGIDMVVKDVPK